MAHTLLAITGMSPAVVTETLYAIARQDGVWPDRLVIVTTSLGAERIAQQLPDVVAALCEDYRKPLIGAQAIEICVIPGAEGMPVADARSEADHEALGDFLMQKVRDLTSDPDMSVHASIAGGRKTMTYYLGYAISLFGRPADRLSHVLVSEPYEGAPDFWYPTVQACMIVGRDGKALDCAKAEVTLADIPFIRLRDRLPRILLGLGETLSFRELVALINVGEQEWQVRHLRLQLPADRPALQVFDASGCQLAEIELKPLDYLFYRMLVRLSLQQSAIVGQSPEKRFPDTDLAEALLDELILLADLRIADRDELLLDSLVAKLERVELVDDLAATFHVSRKSILSLASGMKNTFFNDRCNSIKSTLEAQLPQSLARWLVLRQITDSERRRLDFYQPEWPTNTQKGFYGIPLSPLAITLEDPSS